MSVTGQKLVAGNIIKYGEQFLNAVDDAMENVREILDVKVTENITITDHTLKDLAALGHPYAARHGSRGLSLHEPYYQVHEQSGKLVSAKRSGTIKASMAEGKLEASAYAGIDETIAPHALFVIFGTSKMIPRPVLEGSRDEVLPQAIKIIKTQLKNLMFRFKG